MSQCKVHRSQVEEALFGPPEDYIPPADLGYGELGACQRETPMGLSFISRAQLAAVA